MLLTDKIKCEFGDFIVLQYIVFFSKCCGFEQGCINELRGQLPNGVNVSTSFQNFRLKAVGCLHLAPACSAQGKAGHSKAEQTILDEKKRRQGGELCSFLFPLFVCFFCNKHVIKGLRSTLRKSMTM